jgi:hypothetical protein
VRIYERRSGAKERKASLKRARAKPRLLYAEPRWSGAGEAISAGFSLSIGLKKVQ